MHSKWGETAASCRSGIVLGAQPHRSEKISLGNHLLIEPGPGGVSQQLFFEFSQLVTNCTVF